jgi:hypothetical protein
VKSMGTTQKDWIRLSAYLDGELSKKDRERLEIRLESDPRLLSALEQLRITRKILQSAPELPVPRDFTLSVDMVSRKTSRPVAVGYRLAAALATFMLIGVFVLDFGRFFLGGAMAPAAPEMEKVMLESAADELEEPEAYMTESEVEEEQQAPEEIPETPAEESAPLVEAEKMEGEEAARAAEGVEDHELDAAMETDQEPKAAEEVGDTATNQLEAQETSGIPTPAPSQTPPPQPTVDAFYTEEIPAPAWYARISIFRILEVILGLGAIGFAAAAWYKRRRG